jgi:hypothetical protein
MTKTQALLQRSCSKELHQAVGTSDLTAWASDPATTVVLSRPQKLQPGTGRASLSKESLREIERTLALSCADETEKADMQSVRHPLNLLASAFQLVKPTSSFLELWMQLNSNLLTEMVDRPVTALVGTWGRSRTCNINSTIAREDRLAVEQPLLGVL